jgi:peptidoglycan/xylan/chitin deacetylase (PgdA/CDA1 family)
LLYHRIAEVENDVWRLCVRPHHFREHLEVLRRHRTVRLDRLKPDLWWSGRGLTCAITFDDGYADNLHEAQRALKSFGIPATFFIATGYVGGAREFWWDELERLVYNSPVPASQEGRKVKYLELYERLQPLTDEVRSQLLSGIRPSSQERTPRPSHRTLHEQELAELASDDLFEIGAHTVTHPLLAAQPAEDQFSEVQESKAWLERRLERPVTSFSYPYGGTGHYNAATVHAVRAAGFARACTTTPRDFSSGASPWEIGRLNVPDVCGEEFERLLFA